VSLIALNDYKIEYLLTGRRKENIIDDLHSLLMIGGYYDEL
jgi:hypothetical protein